MQYLKLSAYLLGLALLTACGGQEQQTETTEQEAVSNSSSEKTEKKEQVPRAISLMKGRCFTCHSPRGEQGNRMAPPMIAVKRHYMEGDPSKEEFVSSFVAFTLNPSEEKSKMPGAVERFGLMSNMGFSEGQVRAIAEYLYDNDIQKPDWFEAHYQEEHGEDQASGEVNYLEKGRDLALSTKAVLGKNLMGAIKSRGTVHAVKFCNTRAYPLTDSMATTLKAHIKRVSDEPRNPENKASEQELKHIREMKKALAEGKQPKPVLNDQKDQVTGYYPITTNAMCLQCHGEKGKEIQPKVAQAIDQKYPEDQAKGYGLKQLRGMWVVRMDKSE